ncbi:MAG: hypothetical protein LBJ61_05690 [Deltaproteobacteria bacterium]|jgi:hypothetical protein|nr:hypothetical protein [Deltaproteobacteria bacterium]
MISPALFGRYISPCLEWQIERLEKAIFNLDGLGQAKLLPSVLKLKGLKKGEWNPVPELNPHGVGFFQQLPDSQKPGDHGRHSAGLEKLILTRVLPSQLDAPMAALKPDGLCLSIDAASPSQFEGDRHRGRKV